MYKQSKSNKKKKLTTAENKLSTLVQQNTVKRCQIYMRKDICIMPS